MSTSCNNSPEQLPPRWLLNLYKIFNRSKYRKLRDAAQRARTLNRLTRYGLQSYTMHPAIAGRHCTFKHSGNAGDLIYSLPALRELAGEFPARLRLALDVPLRNQELNHPLGGVMLNHSMYDMLRPLLLEQDYIGELTTHDGLPVDFDLDVFRDAPIPLDKLNISRWYFYFHGITTDLSRPWLSVEPDTRFENRIVIARSARYRNTGIDYSFLSKHKNLIFVGIESEYLEMKQALPSLAWYKVNDFLQLARAIAGCRLFIGNQSFPFALAEALKVPRILETDPLGPNVVPAGPDGYDVLFQRQFVHLVDSVLTRAPALAGAHGR